MIKTKKLNMNKTIIKIFTINIITLILVELIVRAFVTHKSIRNFSDTRRVVTPYVENEFAYLNSNEFSVPYFINNIGIRGEEGENIESGGWDVLLLGDSFSEGWGVSYKESFFKLIENKSQLKMLNFSQNGSGTILHYHRLKYLLQKNKFKKVVLQIFDNDLYDNYRIKNFSPRNDYTPDKVSWLRRVYNVVKSNVRLVYLLKVAYLKIKKKPLPSFQFSSKPNSIEIFSQKEIINKFNLSQKLSDKSHFMKGDFEWYLIDSPKWSEAFSIHRTYIKKIVELTKEHNMTLDIIYIPFHGVWYLEDKDFKSLQNKHLELLAEFQSPDVRLIDLFSRFRNDPNSREYYFALDGHLNKNGHEQVAKYFLQGLQF